jgi:osmotically-inducible protein OsmY
LRGSALEDRDEIVSTDDVTPKGEAAMRSLKTVVIDADLRESVLAELDLRPSVDDSEIHVAVKDGAVSLSGCVTSYSQRHQSVVTRRGSAVAARSGAMTRKQSKGRLL